MEKIKRKNKIIYKYKEKDISNEIIFAILWYVVAILLLILAIFISYICEGEAPLIVGGIGAASIFLDIVSMGYIIYDIYINNNFQKAIRNMLILQLIFIIFWIIIM